MKRKMFVMSLVLLAVVMLVAPVMAKGPPPDNVVDKNPNAVKYMGEVIDPSTGQTVYPVALDLNLPSEVTNRWFGGGVHIVVKSTETVYNPTDILLDDTELPSETSYMQWLINPEYRAKWIRMTKQGYQKIFEFFGLPVPAIPDDGVYLWGGKTS